jgi:hypothetical protein
MALALEHGNVQALQQFIGVGAWDDAAVLQRHQPLVAETLGDPETGVLIVDGCAFPKQGECSVGVARQWCGALGKVANGQASVVATAQRAPGPRPRLHAGRPPPLSAGALVRRGVPPATRPELAVEMIVALREHGVLPSRWVLADEHFGVSTPFLDRVAALGLCYFAEVPHDTRGWLRRPGTAVPPPEKHGRPTHRLRVRPGEPAALRVDALAAQLPAAAWPRWVVRAGARGPLVAEFALVRAVAVRDRLPGPDVWVVLRRRPRAEPELKAYLTNAPRRHESGDAGLAGRDALAGRVGHPGVQERARARPARGARLAGHPLAGRAPPHDDDAAGSPLPRPPAPPTREPVSGADGPAGAAPPPGQPPRRALDAASALALIRDTQRRNYAAHRAHKRRRLRLLDSS